ncbi:TonB-dependent receptor [Neolewinella lacunae]|uniref:TonB-dependent receptor n=1 Tax=Neolewinella lacunae TaxID=1517758 RepID=A0A923PST6_9BACT|nr:TonB-dependent receptor [Neolewinella lacunae]MBC6996844.1 TonB-dependent receptor [Neolewinella lacunae]MDN3633822.1 TonB-dependent receptor [Neolewinella lacunae]
MRYLSLLFLLFPGTCVRAQVADTLLEYIAPLATVRAYGIPLTSTLAAPVSSLTEAELDRYDNSSLLSALNRLPGVRFEERATASYRIAIRGASLRSPFGVRNTQVYWNGIPYGDPGGDVPLNFLDAVNIDRAEVIRGPAGGFYGPGTAGTLLLRTSALDEHRPEATITAGSYGFFRAEVKAGRANATGGANQLRLGYQRTDGYREHSAMERFTVQASSTLRAPRPGQRTDLHALYSKLDYELPGALTPEQFADDPRQARPGSVDKNASIHYHNLLLGLTDARQLGRWSSELALYTTGFYFDHPFNVDYKREANLGGGFRLALRRDLHQDLALTFGTEYRLQYRMGQNFSNPAGAPGELNFADEIFSRQGLRFGQLVYTPGAWDFHLGLSNTGLSYAVDRTFAASGPTGQTDFRARRPLALRLAAGRTIGQHYVYASRADGFSPPTLDEFRTNEGSLNLALDPELGTNYELGYRYATGRFSAEASAFYFALREAITSFTDDRGTQLFRNAGRTRQQGLELALSYHLLRQAQEGIDLRGAANYTFYDFTYREFQRGTTDFSGQRIPGAAPHTVNLEVITALKNGWFLDLFYNFTDAIPLDDANEVRASAYHFLRASLGYRTGRLTFFAAGANLLGEKMSFGDDLNPQFGRRYFQPAPGRNWQLGVRLAGR